MYRARPVLRQPSLGGAGGQASGPGIDASLTRSPATGIVVELPRCGWHGHASDLASGNLYLLPRRPAERYASPFARHWPESLTRVPDSDECRASRLAASRPSESVAEALHALGARAVSRRVLAHPGMTVLLQLSHLTRGMFITSTAESHRQSEARRRTSPQHGRTGFAPPTLGLCGSPGPCKFGVPELFLCWPSGSRFARPRRRLARQTRTKGYRFSAGVTEMLCRMCRTDAETVHPAAFEHKPFSRRAHNRRYNASS